MRSIRVQRSGLNRSRAGARSSRGGDDRSRRSVVDSRSSRPGLFPLESEAGAASPTSRRALPTFERGQALDVSHEDRDGLVASVEGGLIIVVETLSPLVLNAMARTMARLAAHHGTFFTLTITERKSGSGVSPERRAATADLLRKHARHVSCAAVVCEGTGFRATAVRSIVTALHMASRATHPTKVFDSVGAAATWLHGKQGAPQLSAAELGELASLARSRHRERCGAAANAEPTR